MRFFLIISFLVFSKLSYGNKISDIHIKDRKLGGNSVILGKGDADFKSFFTTSTFSSGAM